MYRNERSVGAALARSAVSREDVFVTTKWMPMMRGPGRELARSLERLGLEYVDLYLIHWTVPLRAAHGWAELQTLRERGLVRAVGVSNSAQEKVAELLQGVAHDSPCSASSKRPRHRLLRGHDEYRRSACAPSIGGRARCGCG